MTSQLRKLFKRCVKEVEKIEQPRRRFRNRNEYFTLKIRNSVRGCGGRATVDGHYMSIDIARQYGCDNPMPRPIRVNGYLCGVRYPSPDRNLNFKEKERLARIMIHEYYHTIGYRHHDRRRYKSDFTKSWDVSWVNEYDISPSIV